MKQWSMSVDDTRTLSGGDHASVVGGEEDLRLTVFSDEDLVLGDRSVPGLHHCVTTHRSQVATRHVPQRYAAQLTRRPEQTRM